MQRPTKFITPFQLSLTKGKTPEEQTQLIKEYKQQAEIELAEYSATLDKYKRYEIRVRLDEHRRGLEARCSTHEIKTAVEEIIETQRYLVEEPWDLQPDHFEQEDSDSEQEELYQQARIRNRTPSR
jgi:hypothetical protein